MWRLVEDGEIIQSGDEIYSSIKDEDWVECPTSVGETFSLEIMYPVRRKINTAESQNSTSTNKHMEQGLKSQIIAVVERRVNAQKMGYLDSGLERKLWDELRELLHV